MAKIKMAHIVAEIRGKVGGTVFSRNHAGAYIREKVTPINPKTAKQTGVRTFFTVVAQLWRDLTAAQRLQWRSAVQNFKSTNIFGDVKVLTGSQLHQKLNVNLLNIGETVIAVPPTPTEVVGVESLSAAVAAGAGTMSLTFSPAIDAGVNVELFATPPLSAGKTFVKNLYKKLNTLDSTNTSPYNAKAAYEAIYGSVGSEGQKIFFKMRPINNTTGIPGSDIEASTIVAA